VLELRNRQLEAVQQRFAAQHHRVIHLQDLIADVHAQLDRELKVRPDDDIIDPVLSQQRFRYIQYLKSQLDHLREALQRETAILERIREEMREAHVNKKSLELLEDKQHRRYLKHLEDQEAKEIEDLVMARRNMFPQ
jgi:flagellar export protein FliJ